MKISQEARQKAYDIKKMISEQTPEVIYALMDFCTFDETEPMSREGVEDAEQEQEQEFNFATYKQFNRQTLYMGMNLPRIKVDLIGEEDSYDLHDWKFSEDQKASGESIKREKELDV